MRRRRHRQRYDPGARVLTDATADIGPAARYYEDFREGERVRTQGRTVTDVDRVLWAMFTGDMNPMHVDVTFATEHGPFGGAFPPGLMAVAIASGLKERTGLFAGTGRAMLEQTIRYRAPVLAGDTVHVILEVADRNARGAKPDGRITFRYQIARDDGTVCVEGDWVMLVAKRHAAS